MESATTITLPRGFVDTTATDGRRLRIYYIRETIVVPANNDDINARTTASNVTRPTTIEAESVDEDDVNKAKLTRAAEIGVLRDFAAGYTRGDLDLNGKVPYNEVRPIGIILVRASHHVSKYTGFEPLHITVDVSSEESWAEGLGFARTGIHVFSVDDVVAMGYKNYDKKKSKRKGQGL
ncbi:hypothetical protein E4U15_006558 [Claviceps sp. LM218 group G6]|nr:hypothetical protein E4U15_006558 [Claviceps sp. LM218 group G6]